LTVLLLLAGVVLLVGGAELLVRGASGLALALRVPPLMVGLTVVAFGTSSPELAVSTGAALGGNAAIALGNVVGSNIFNVLLILGLAALASPLQVASRLVRRDVPIMIGVSLVLLVMALDGRIGRVEGVLLLFGTVAYLGYLFLTPKQDSAAVGSATAERLAPGVGRRRESARALALDGALIVVGLLFLVLGARWLVAAAREIAVSLGVSELVIGLTIVAGGTSLPELATSVLASLRGQRDIAVGNVVGSNILNILAILGVAATIAPAGIAVSPAAITFDIPVMAAVAVLALPVFFSGAVIARWEGAIFVALYAAYATYLGLAATAHEALPAFRDAMVFFALPSTVLTVVMVALRERRAP
jgi:cation:H+ antiporter